MFEAKESERIEVRVKTKVKEDSCSHEIILTGRSSFMCSSISEEERMKYSRL